MIDVTGRRIDLAQLMAELTTAGVVFRGLGTTGTRASDGKNFLHTYTQVGVPADLPAGAQAVVDAHVPPPIPPVPDFGADLPSDYVQQLANAVGMLRQYLGLASPTLAQSVTAIKLLIRVAFFLLRLNRLG